jgi:hypothetical protein
MRGDGDGTRIRTTPAQETSMPEKPTVQLEGWQLLTLHDQPFQLMGFASDHPRLPGHRRWVQTSRVLWLSDDGTEAETVNTRYRLQRPIHDMRFELAYPVFISLADLTAERIVIEDWRISGNGKLLVSGIPGYQIAILCMLDLLDQRSE